MTPLLKSIIVFFLLIALVIFACFEFPLVSFAIIYVVGAYNVSCGIEKFANYLCDYTDEDE